MKKIFVIALVTLVILLSNGALASTNGTGSGGAEQSGSMTQTVFVKDVSYYDDGSGGSGDDSQYGSVSGTVFGTYGWALVPLIFAPVSAGSKSTLTGFGGGYSIGNLAYGTHTVTASYPGYVSQSQTITLTVEHPSASVSFTLQKSGGGGGGDSFEADLAMIRLQAEQKGSVTPSFEPV
ncbi:MAG: carboxypeptidase-like regulatory domain-containing protein [Euryarchaeota archaeon]|nr:carboxypeptidase-like regulatory domain-containing protein [Euryarchaeota archaeon]